MAGTDLDDITVNVDCPECGTMIIVPYSQVRIQKAAACSCGALIRLTDDTPIAMLQALIDEANPIDADND
ncbi:MAG: hypothetical protein JWO65_2504 [Sphingomonas bacterium]|jgi:uncharacterized paraquat-inducible protein A|nr:hypothetical protein [Sphingomonas bacterium]